MDFSHFLKNKDQIKQFKLGGINAQFKLAPQMRKRYSQIKIEAQHPKKAAILALFYPDKKGKTHFLLTLRAQYNGTHSSQISFPGGKFDLHDKTLENTSLRETYEEVGIPPEEVTILKQLSNVYIPPSNFLVTPFLGFLTHTPSFIKNHEVQKTISVSLSDLLSRNAISETTLSTSYAKNITVPCYVLNNYTVWGATAMILSELKDLMCKL